MGSAFSGATRSKIRGALTGFRSGAVSKSLTWRFLLFVVPVSLVTFALVVAGFVYWAYHDAYARLPQKLSVESASLSMILGPAVAAKDNEQVGLTIAASISDPDIVGIAVYDGQGMLMDRYGDGIDEAAHLIQRSPITYVTESGVSKVGTLVMAASDNRIRAELARLIKLQLIVCGALLVVLVIVTMLAFRTTIMRPLRRLLVSMRLHERNPGSAEPVEWDRDDEMGQVIRAYNSMQESRDVAQRDLVAAKEAADTANRAKTAFLANMSHELRTPLNAIIGFSEIIRDASIGEGVDEKYRDYAGVIHHSGQHLLDIIQDILDVARIEAGRVDMEESEICLPDLAEDCRAMLSARAQSRGVELRVNMPPDLPRLWGDARLVRQLLLNLLSNSIKFTLRGGHVDLQGAVEDGCIVIRVVDTGIGIPKEHQERVFGAFQQVALSRTRNHEGTGLGLSICRKLMDLHDGQTLLESEVGVGTTVTLRFPAERTVEQAQEPALAASGRR